MSCETLSEELAAEREAILQEFRFKRLELEKQELLGPDSGIADLQVRGLEVLVEATFTNDIVVMNRLVDHARVLGERIGQIKEAEARRKPQPFYDPRVESEILHR